MYSHECECYGANLALSELCDCKESKSVNLIVGHKARVSGIDSESDREIMKNLSYIYVISSPIQKYIIKLLLNQTRILLNEGPILLPQGFKRYD